MVPGAVAEDVDRATERIVAERPATHGGEPINPFAEIDGLRGQQDTTLRGELEHQGVSKKVRTRAASGRLRLGGANPQPRPIGALEFDLRP